MGWPCAISLRSNGKVRAINATNASGSLLRGNPLIGSERTRKPADTRREALAARVGSFAEEGGVVRSSSSNAVRSAFSSVAKVCKTAPRLIR